MIAALARIAVAAAGAVAGVAVARELDKPPAERQWHGEVGGVPYDFRPPTVEKLRRSLWDENNPKVIVPHGFGVGWSVNFARLAALAQPPEPAPKPSELTAKPAAEPPAVEPPATTPATEPSATATPAAESPASTTPATEPPASTTPATGPPAATTPVTEPTVTKPAAAKPTTTEPPATEPPAAGTAG